MICPVCTPYLPLGAGAHTPPWSMVYGPGVGPARTLLGPRDFRFSWAMVRENCVDQHGPPPTHAIARCLQATIATPIGLVRSLIAIPPGSWLVAHENLVSQHAPPLSQFETPERTVTCHGPHNDRYLSQVTVAPSLMLAIGLVRSSHAPDGHMAHENLMRQHAPPLRCTNVEPPLRHERRHGLPRK